LTNAKVNLNPLLHRAIAAVVVLLLLALFGFFGWK
jgi:hypothetical protein